MRIKIGAVTIATIAEICATSFQHPFSFKIIQIGTGSSALMKLTLQYSTSTGVVYVASEFNLNLTIDNLFGLTWQWNDALAGNSVTAYTKIDIES